MTEKPHVFERPASLRDLAKLGLADLETWLVRSAALFVEATTPSRRLSAFDPLIIPQFEHPARFIANWWLAAGAEQKGNFSEAVANAIETLSPASNIDAVLLTFGIGTHFGSARKLEPLYAYLSREIRGTAVQKQRLGQTIAHWARRRGESRDMVRLAYRLKEKRVLDAIGAVELLTYGAVAERAEIIGHFGSLLAPWFGTANQDYTAEDDAIYKYFACTCVDTLGVIDSFQLSLQAQERGMLQMRQAIEANRITVKPYSQLQWRRGEPLYLVDVISGNELPFSTKDWKYTTLSFPTVGIMKGEKTILTLVQEFSDYSVDKQLERM